MARTVLKEQLRIRIVEGDRKEQRLLRGSDKFTVGRDPGNDVVLFGEDVPKRHALLSKQGGRYILLLLRFMDGEVGLGDARLKFADLVDHGLLERKGDSILVPLTSGKQGHVNLGRARVDFACETVKVTAPPPVAEFSWVRAFLKDAVQDPLFKLVFVVLLVGTGFFISKLTGMTIPERKPVDLEAVPQRFARFIMRSEVEPVVESDRATAAIPSEGNAKPERKAESNDAERRRSESRGSGEGRERPIVTRGLLGLISGTGGGERNGSLIDALMDKGLVQELAEVAGETNLKVGRRDGSETGVGDGLDELFEATSAGGIDDLLADLDEQVPVVELKKEGSVSIERPGAITASDEARGQRDETSLLTVVRANMGRITYIYNKYLKRNPDLQGKVSVDITISASGRVSKVDVVESTVADREFVNELVTAVRRWRFDPIDRGTIVVNYPFVFYRES